MKPPSPTLQIACVKRLAAFAAAGAGLALGLAGSGCVNSRLSSLLNQASTSGLVGASGATGPTGSSLTNNFVIGNVVIAVPSSSGSSGSSTSTSSTPVTTIYFDPTQSQSAGGVTTPPLMTQYCSGSSSSSSGTCACQFSWSETNSSTGSNVSYTRSVQTPVSNVQQELVTCNAPDVYTAEISNGTTIQITVVPVAGNSNSSLFTVNTYGYVKNTTAVAGSFQDAEGNAFDNVVHYSCYEQFQIGTTIQSQMGLETNKSTGQAEAFPMANQFCVQSPNSTGGTQQCPNMPSGGTNSAQAYYYNFFIRVSQVGDVNQWNDRYTCPAVKEPIYGNVGVGSQGQLYPLDTNFALQMAPSATFNVGVNAFVELSDGGSDPVAAGAQTCDGSTPAGNNSTSGFVQACLGYAATPASDGTCPTIKDSTGAVRFTYRLRRFIALYPPLFGINGSAPTDPQRTDTIYVLDRPVSAPSNSNPLKPYTMRGPKPCPFALFDSKGVTGTPDALYPNQVLPQYAATTNSSWNGTNVDNIKLPNFDSPQSCSAALPLTLTNVLNPDLTVISIGTVNALNPVLKNVYIRPIHSWAPHYEEDTSFLACAPQSSPTHDPPLHFAKDPTTGNVDWCAEVYPSQNDHVAALDVLTNTALPVSATNPYIGHVRPYDSHVVKNSLSATCAATIPSSIPTPTGEYPAPSAPNSPTASCPATIPPQPSGLAWHGSDILEDTVPVFNTSGVAQTPRQYCANVTCDRTAIITGGLGWQQFPILASAFQTEQAISSDSTFGCVMTYDGGGPKTGKSTPTGGCCGANVQLTTGLPPAVGSGGTNTAGLANMSAHLEPDVPCLIPTY